MKSMPAEEKKERKKQAGAYQTAGNWLKVGKI